MFLLRMVIGLSPMKLSVVTLLRSVRYVFYEFVAAEMVSQPIRLLSAFSLVALILTFPGKKERR